VHRFVLIVLSALVALQLGVYPRASGFGNFWVDSAHTMLHMQDSGHHHHEDGSFHADDSDESVLHLLADQGISAAVIFSASAGGFLVRVTLAPAPGDPPSPTSPFLDGHLRPPRVWV
jgi:hypothetical protein